MHSEKEEKKKQHKLVDFFFFLPAKQFTTIAEY